MRRIRASLLLRCVNLVASVSLFVGTLQLGMGLWPQRFHDDTHDNPTIR